MVGCDQLSRGVEHLQVQVGKGVPAEAYLHVSAQDRGGADESLVNILGPNCLVAGEIAGGTVAGSENNERSGAGWDPAEPLPSCKQKYHNRESAEGDAEEKNCGPALASAGLLNRERSGGAPVAPYDGR